MEILGRIMLFYSDMITLNNWRQIVATLIVLCILSIMVLLWVLKRRREWKREALRQSAGVRGRGRFIRKRDRVAFYMKRVVRSIKKEIKEKKQRVEKLRFRGHSKEFTLREKNKHSMESFDHGAENSMLPEELMTLYNSMKIYGLFDRHLLLELCRSMVKITYNPGEYLFKAGKIEVGFIVVLYGKVNLSMTTKNGELCLLKQLGQGDTLHSTLHIFHQFMGDRNNALEIEAQVLLPTAVYQISAKTFCDLISQENNFQLKLAQMVIFRFHQVTLAILSEIFGLVSEITSKKIKPFVDGNDNESNEKNDKEAPLDVEPVTIGHHQASALSRAVARVSQLFGTTEFNESLLLVGKIVDMAPGAILYQDTKPMEHSLYFVLKGRVNAMIKNKISKKMETAIQHSSGEFLGIVDLLITGNTSYIYRCSTKTTLLAISRPLFKQIIRKKPDILCTLAHNFVSKVSKFVKCADFVIEWSVHADGKPVYLQGSCPSKVFLVLNGRLSASRINHNDIGGLSSESFNWNDKNASFLCEYGRHDIIGLVEAIQERNHFYSLHAIRTSELGSIPVTLLSAAKSIYPSVMENITHVLSRTLLKTQEDAHLSIKQQPNSFSTFAVVAASENVPLDNFSFELSLAMEYFGNTCIVSRKSFEKVFPEGPQFSDIHQSSFLSQLELSYRYLIFKADPAFTEWTNICILQADVILIVALGSEKPIKSELIERIERTKNCHVQKHLVLLHEAERYRATAKITRPWLDTLKMVSNHYHIRLNHRSLNKNISIRKLYKSHEGYNVFPTRTSDVCRLARMLTGNAIGLCLSGGGARGLAHLGIIKSLEEHGIPVDMVSGTSMGSFVGGAYALNKDLSETTKLATNLCRELTRVFSFILDLTMPMVSLLTGKNFNSAIHQCFRDLHMEDLILPYYCVTVDITDVDKRVHDSGVLWKYIRASMSLPTYIPPLCDPVDGHLLVDGGFINNLPADVLRSHGSKTIIAVDVSAPDNFEFSNYGDSLSGWRVFLGKFIPFVKPLKVPSMSEIQLRLACVCFYSQQTLVKNLENTIYLRPPIEKYSTLQFNSFTQIYEDGYKFMNDVLVSKNEVYLSYEKLFKKLLESDSIHKKYITRMVRLDEENVSKTVHPFKELHFNAPPLTNTHKAKRKHKRAMSATEQSDIIHVLASEANIDGSYSDCNSF